MTAPDQKPDKAALRAFRARKYAFFDALVRDGGPTVLEIRLAWRLVDRLNPNTGDSWPSLETIACELHCDLRALKRAAKRLEEGNWFFVRRGGGCGRSNHYVPNWKKVAKEPPVSDKAQPETVAGEFKNSGSPVSETVAGQPPESIKEPEYESVGAGHISASKRGKPAPTAPSGRQIGTLVTNGDGPIARQDDRHSADDWEEWIDWLYRQGRYNEEWGFDNRDLAADDVDKLRRECGDAGAIRCLEAARNRGLHGPVLRHHVETGPNYYGRRSPAK